MRQHKNLRVWLLWMLLLAASVTLAMATSGCETLRKKFTRHKKNDAPESTGIEPVLDPVEYPDKVYSTVDRYKEHFMLYKVWARELMESLDEQESDKKQKYNVDATLAQMTEMQQLLTGEKQSMLTGLGRKLGAVRAELDKPKGLRNYSLIAGDVKQIDKKIRDQFKPEQLEGSFATLHP